MEGGVEEGEIGEGRGKGGVLPSSIHLWALATGPQKGGAPRVSGGRGSKCKGEFGCARGGGKFKSLHPGPKSERKKKGEGKKNCGGDPLGGLWAESRVEHQGGPDGRESRKNPLGRGGGVPRQKKKPGSRINIGDTQSERARNKNTCGGLRWKGRAKPRRM